MHGASDSAVSAHPTKLLVIVEENEDAKDARAHMPYLRSLGNEFGRATRYRALTHPSPGNYLAITAGSTFGVRDDKKPPAHRLTGPTVFDQALAHGKSARTYAETMPQRCDPTNSGSYAARHNPWTYFTDARSRRDCRRDDVTLGTRTKGRLIHDVRRGRLPTVGLVVPNTCNDAHSCSLHRADHWLRRWIPTIRRGTDWQAGRLAIVITFDENDGTTPNRVLTVVMSQRTHHVLSRARLSHYSLTRYADHLIGARPLRHAVGARSVASPFDL
jgi:acid phosphatase